MRLSPPRAVRRAFRVGLVVVVLALLVGMTVQGVATAIERRAFSRPGRLVDLGEYQLHMLCTGEGTPTVILEAPESGLSVVWDRVQSALGTETRTCSYDRAGLGWSEAPSGQYDYTLVPDDLRALLERSNEPRPVILVGVGIGSAFARLYAARFPGDVAGLVVDNTPAQTSPAAWSSLARRLRVSPWLARTGLTRLTRPFGYLTSELSSEPSGAVAAFLNRPDHLTRAAQEVRQWRDITSAAAGSAIDLSIPVAVVPTTIADLPAFPTSAETAERIVIATRDVIEQIRAVRTPSDSGGDPTVPETP